MNNKRMLAAMLLLIAAAANAQTIYRCGNSYSADPCPGATVVAAPPVPSPAEVAAAREEAKREGELADAMHTARAKQDAERPSSVAESHKGKSRASRGGPVKPVIFGHSSGKAKDAKPAKKQAAAISRPASRAPAAAGTSAKGSPGSR